MHNLHTLRATAAPRSCPCRCHLAPCADRIIGCKAQKTMFLSVGALPRVLHLLLTEGSTDVQAQCATALGSFAYGSPTGLEQLLASGGMQGLVSTLTSGEAKVVEAGVRALKLVFAQVSICGCLNSVDGWSSIPCFVGGGKQCRTC